MKKENLNISYIANKSEISEDSLRDFLFSHNIISKKSLKHIDKNLFKENEKLIKTYIKPKEIKHHEKTIPFDKKSLNPISPIIEKQVIFTKKEICKKKKKEKVSNDWFTVGRLEEHITLLSPADIKAIHEILVEDFKKSKDPIDPPGVKSEDLLESAVFRPRTALGSENKYPTIAMAGAALLHAIIHNHPFHNGNKRTALSIVNSISG